METALLLHIRNSGRGTYCNSAPGKYVPNKSQFSPTVVNFKAKSVDFLESNPVGFRSKLRGDFAEN